MPVTITESYGSKTYENIVVGSAPLAVFGYYISSSSSIYDLTNKNHLTARIAAGASYSNQVPFFALPAENYTFDINASNKISITENTVGNTNNLGMGRFSLGDERSDFAVEFLLSKNYDSVSNSDFARFGIYNSQQTVGISYDYPTNSFYLNVYSQNGYVVHRSAVFAKPVNGSKHFVINFISGKPEMYVNGIKAKTLINNLGTKTFFAPKTTGRTVAEFSCSDSSQRLLVSMIAFYGFALKENLINKHYAALFDEGELKSFSSKLGAPVIYETINFNEKISKNDGNSQDFLGTNVYNIITEPYIKIDRSPTFEPYFVISQKDSNIYVSGSSVSQNIGFSMASTDYASKIKNDVTMITFAGTGTGSFTAENNLLYLEGTSVGDIYVAIDSASSRLVIGTGSGTVLARSSASVGQKPAKTLYISFSGSTMFANFSDDSDSASYNFGSEITTDSAKMYLFNRYYNNNSNAYVAGGNSQLDFYQTYASNPATVFVRLTTPYLNSSGSVIWNYYQYKEGQALIPIPIPSNSYNYFYSYDSENISYTLYADSSSATIYQGSYIYIPTTSSYAAISASMGTYWGGNMYYLPDDSYIRNISLYNFSSSSATAGAYPAVITTSSGLINTAEVYPNIFKQKNIGFVQSVGNLISIQKNNINFNDIGQIDFLIAIPNYLITSPQQYLIDNGPTSSMTLTYTSASGAYLLNFSGMTASVNGITATSGSTALFPRQHYFIQSTLTTAIPNGSSFSMFSASDTQYPFQHSFDRVSVYESSASYARSRYSQVFGRKSIKISDDDNIYLRIQSLPDNTQLLNKDWQLYFS